MADEVSRSAARQRERRIGAALGVGAALVFGAALLVGAAGLDVELIRALRLPRVLGAAGVGALLALSGLAMQVLLRNPLADPYVLGTSGGASIGALLALLAGLSVWPGAALGALIACALLLLLARSTLAAVDDASPRLILIGAMLSALFGAFATLLLSVTPDPRLRGALFWLAGDLSGLGEPWPALVVAGLATMWIASQQRGIDRLLLGVEAAALLGEPVRRLRLQLLVGAALTAGVAVASAGAIGFVGLVVPQALRLAGVQRGRPLAWMSALAGAALLALADLVARTVAAPTELPVGAVMALIGAPFFIRSLMADLRLGDAARGALHEVTGSVPAGGGHDEPPKADAVAGATPLLQARGLTLGGGRVLLRELQWQAQPGERWCVIGRNAAGKSTLLRALAALPVPRHAGEVAWCGRPAADWPPQDAARLRACMPQQPVDRFAIDVRRLLELSSVDPEADMLAVLRALDAEALVDRPVTALSGGERQRVALAQCAMQGARVWLLDEPVSFQDPAHQQQVARWLAAAGDVAIVMSAHDVNWVGQVATHVLALDGEGGWEAGPVALMLEATRLQRVFGCPWREAGGLWQVG